MTEFDMIRNLIIDYEENEIDKDQLIDEITKVCFARPSKKDKDTQIW